MFPFSTVGIYPERFVRDLERLSRASKMSDDFGHVGVSAVGAINCTDDLSVVVVMPSIFVSVPGRGPRWIFRLRIGAHRTQEGQQDRYSGSLRASTRIWNAAFGSKDHLIGLLLAAQGSELLISFVDGSTMKVKSWNPIAHFARVPEFARYPKIRRSFYSSAKTSVRSTQRTRTRYASCHVSELVDRSARRGVDAIFKMSFRLPTLISCGARKHCRRETSVLQLAQSVCRHRVFQSFRA